MSVSILSKGLGRRILVSWSFSDIQSARSLTTKQLSPTISFITKSDAPMRTTRGKPSEWDFPSEGRPLSILLCWLMAKNNAVNKYAGFYLDKGFDVMTVRITPPQLLLPTKTNRIVEEELMPILLKSNHPKSLVHGFSVGGYVFGQMLRVANEEPGQYKPTMDKMVAQIWDSVVDVQGTAIGVSKSVFPKAQVAQKLLKDYIDFHMRIMENVSTKHYLLAHDYFYDKPLRAPALFLNSENDPISQMSVIEALQTIWTGQAGIPVTTKIWPNTPHVGHMQRHPDEYKRTVTEFLAKTGLKGGRVLDAQKNPVFSPEYNVVS